MDEPHPLEAVELEVWETDFSRADQSSIGAAVDGDAVLGGEVIDPGLRQAVLDGLPRAVARRVERMVPEGFEAHELRMSFTLSGAPWGVGVGGEVVVTFRPRGA
jgi:hypothetical protein